MVKESSGQARQTKVLLVNPPQQLVELFYFIYLFCLALQHKPDVSSRTLALLPTLLALSSTTTKKKRKKTLKKKKETARTRQQHTAVVEVTVLGYGLALACPVAS